MSSGSKSPGHFVNIAGFSNPSNRPGKTSGGIEESLKGEVWREGFQGVLADSSVKIYQLKQ